MRWAAVSTLGTPFDIETVSTSDDIATRLSEIQLDVGEGPGWEAYAIQAPVVVPELSEVGSARWPMFRHAVTSFDVRAVYSLPLTIGTLRIGVVDLYSEATNSLTRTSISDASALADTTAIDLLRHALDHRFDEPEDDGPHSRREVHQATGMVIAQMQVGPDDAVLLIRAHAYSSGRTVRETAADIVARRITLHP